MKCLFMATSPLEEGRAAASAGPDAEHGQAAARKEPTPVALNPFIVVPVQPALGLALGVGVELVGIGVAVRAVALDVDGAASLEIDLERPARHGVEPGLEDRGAALDALHARDRRQLPYAVLGPVGDPVVGIAARDGVPITGDELMDRETILDRTGEAHDTPFPKCLRRRPMPAPLLRQRLLTGFRPAKT